MALILPCVLPAYQSVKTDWHPKEIAYPQEMGRVAFQTYVPSAVSGFKVRRVLLVWVPKLEEFPGSPGRQAVRITVEDKGGRMVELIETPSISLPCQANISQIIGQGYLNVPLKFGTSMVMRDVDQICIGLISKDFETSRLHGLGERLKLFAQPAPSR